MNADIRCNKAAQGCLKPAYNPIFCFVASSFCLPAGTSFVYAKVRFNPN